MAVTVTKLKYLGEDAVVSANDGTYVYLGFANGNIAKYTIASAALDPDFAHIDGRPISMTVYSGTLYVSSESGDLYGITTS
jgi:hypothetical protein